MSDLPPLSTASAFEICGRLRLACCRGADASIAFRCRRASAFGGPRVRDLARSAIIRSRAGLGFLVFARFEHTALGLDRGESRGRVSCDVCAVAQGACLVSDTVRVVGEGDTMELWRQGGVSIAPVLCEKTATTNINFSP